MVCPAQNTRILIADDHMMFCDALRSLLEQEPDFIVVGVANDGSQVLKLVPKLRPDLLLLDIAMPGMTGLEVLEKLPACGVAVRTIILAASADKSQRVELLRLGARGIVLKDQATELLFKAIRAVMTGEYWIGHAGVADLIDILRLEQEPRESKPAEKQSYTLSKRELEIVASVADGCTNREIADTFSLSEQTVKHHLTRIFAKTGASNRLELAVFAMQRRLDTARSQPRKMLFAVSAASKNPL